jgi:hypothetical protein
MGDFSGTVFCIGNLEPNNGVRLAYAAEGQHRLMTMVEMLKYAKTLRSFFSFPLQHVVILKRRQPKPNEEEPASSKAESVNGCNTTSGLNDDVVPESGRMSGKQFKQWVLPHLSTEFTPSWFKPATRCRQTASSKKA